MNIVKIEAQHDFPKTDLTEANEELLELLLQNRAILDASHESAESARQLFSLGHAAFLRMATSQFEDEDRIAAFSHGISIYEAISALARPRAFPESAASVALQVITTQHDLQHDFTGTLTDARDRLRIELPRTYQVIGKSAARFCKNDTDYALAGAAISRQLEVDTRS